MTVIQRGVLATAAVLELFGFVFLAALMYFVVRYFIETENLLRHELTLGAGIAGICSAGALLLAAALGASLESVLSRRTIQWICWPGLIMGGVVFLWYIGSIAAAL